MDKMKYAGFAGAALILLILIFNSYTTVEAGHNKVATMFGKVQPEPYDEGFHIVNPLLDFVDFDLRQQTHTWQKVHVPSQDKLKTSMDISVTFRLDGVRTPTILQETGTLQDVVIKHVTPKVRSLLREAGKSVEQSQDFYLDSVQDELQRYMEDGLRAYLEAKGVIVTAVLFRDITLPDVVTNAVIQTKERQEQLEREKAQLKIVEQQAQQQVKQAEAREMAAVSDANAKKFRPMPKLIESARSRRRKPWPTSCWQNR
nr:SPFH domain-containing protein [Methylomarinum sp. Ch1-1]MDP4522447.1 SPFH domain-containing protein [Methylomarinum sp. Ch1-1]